MDRNNSRSVCIVTHAHLCRNPRVLKEARSLDKVGYKVDILTIAFSGDLKILDEDLIKGTFINIEYTVDLTKRGVKSYWWRAKSRFSKLLVAKFRVEAASALGYGYKRFVHTAIRKNASIYICHQEMPTCVGVELIKCGFKVAFDFEDLYSEDLLQVNRIGRPIALLRSAENFALSHGEFVITTSKAMANEVSLRAARINKIEVVYNVFPLHPDILSGEKSYQMKPIRMVWFSQTIGPGRGLEKFLSVLKDINYPVEVHLLGHCNHDFKIQLTATLGNRHPLVFHDFCDPDTLPYFLSEFDIGLALEENQPLNRDITITNKIFQYFQAGIPVIATRTQGQMEVFSMFPAGLLFDYNDTIHDRIHSFISDQVGLVAARKIAVDAATKLCWENEEQKIISLLNGIN